MFAIAKIEGERADAILHGLLERVKQTADIFAHNRPRHFTYDDTATMTYEGMIVRGGGAEASVFHIAKPGSFFIVIYLPDPDEFAPTIVVAGDQDQAEKFLLAFQIAGGDWA